MILRRNAATWLAMVAIAVLTAAVLAQDTGVRFLAPENGAQVRGVVEVRAERAGGSQGWISYKIAKAGQEGEYVAAVIAPFVYRWNTRARSKKGEPLYPDGDYVLTATAFDPSGNKLGEASITVTVANEVAAADVPGPVELVCSYIRAQKLAFKAKGRLKVTLPEKEKKKLYIPLNLDVFVEAEWEEEVLSPTAGDAPAIVDKRVRSGFVQIAGGEGVNLPSAGKTFRLTVAPDGKVDVYKEGHHFPLGENYVELPERAVSKGDSWPAEVSIVLLPSAVATHLTGVKKVTLDGFEYVAGQKCARIVATFSQKEKPVRVRLGRSIIPLKTTYKAQRICYFGLETKHFVAFEDRVSHTLKIPVQFVQMLYQIQLGGAAKTAQAGMGGMMGAGAMGGMMGPMMGGMGPMAGEPGMMGAGMATPGGTGLQPYGPGAAGVGGFGGMSGPPAGMAAMEGMAGAGGMGAAMPGLAGGAQAQQAQTIPVLVESELRITEIPAQ